VNREEVKIADLLLKIGDFWQGRTDSLFCGKATAVASVHRTLAKSRLSNPPSKYPNAQKDQSERIGLFAAVTDYLVVT
jgi:hypothetical protein